VLNDCPALQIWLKIKIKYQDAKENQFGKECSENSLRNYFACIGFSPKVISFANRIWRAYTPSGTSPSPGIRKGHKGRHRQINSVLARHTISRIWRMSK
jgi:hypothetical protein